MSIVFDPNIHIQTIALVGLGGTGAQLARLVARILYDMRRAGRETPIFLLIDPDVVEEKNVGRQLFAPSDVGLHKAHVVGSRLNRALGLDAGWILEAVEPRRHLRPYNSTLILSCVDNHAARAALCEVQGTWVSVGCGNHDTSGQVVIGNTLEREALRRNTGEQWRYLPAAGLLFPELLEPPEEETPAPPADSCADRLASGEQHLLINDFIATIAADYVYKLLHRQPISTFLTNVNLNPLGLTSKPIHPDELAVYLDGVGG